MRERERAMGKEGLSEMKTDRDRQKQTEAETAGGGTVIHHLRDNSESLMMCGMELDSVSAAKKKTHNLTR